MSLPPALLQRLAQRGLVQKQKSKEHDAPPAENEEVIAEDYDEMDPDEQQHGRGPEGYEHLVTRDTRKRTEENFWLERMRARMGEASSVIGYKGCPNKYNIWHKCTLFCVNRWGEGHAEPSREYMRRYKRMLRKYPLPKGWTEMYDAGCGCYYFCNVTENVVSWLPPTHPKSQVSKSAAAYRRQMEEANGDGGSGGGGVDSDDDAEQHDDDTDEHETSQQREIDEIINASMRPRSPPGAILLPQDFPSLQEATTKSTAAGATGPRKQKSRDLERTLLRQRRDRERDGGRNARRHARETGGDALDPMDPSAYSDIPRGKWSDGLQKSGGEERKKGSAANGNDENRERGSGGAGGSGGSTRDRRDEESDDESPEDY